MILGDIDFLATENLDEEQQNLIIYHHFIAIYSLVDIIKEVSKIF